MPLRHKALGCASIYNDQVITPLRPFQHNPDDERYTRIPARPIDPIVTRTLPRHLAFPDPIIHSLVDPQPINDITGAIIRRTLHTLLAAHTELFSTRENIERIQTLYA